MNKNTKISALLVLFVLTMAGCGDFLEEKSQSEVIPTTVQDYSELLLGSGYPGRDAPTMTFIEYLDDDCMAQLDYQKYDATDKVWIDGFAGEQDAVTPMPYFTWQPYMNDQDGFGNLINTYAGSTSYASFYNKIKGCNAVLDGIGEAVGSDEDRNRVIAEALTVRAWLYFVLVNLYGEPYNYNKEALGVPLKTDANLSIEGIGRSTVAECYENLLVPDLLRAAELFAPLEINTKDYHVNLPTVYILLSRVYLFMEQYDKCVEQAGKALDCGIRLMNLNTELASYTSNNKLDYNNPEVQWNFGASVCGNATMYRTGLCTDFRSIWDPVNDLRWQQFRLEMASTGNVMAKVSPDGLRQNIRTAEAYLNRMEAYALMGNDEAALTDLNTFLATRMSGFTPLDLHGDSLLQRIRDERRKEFCFEGFRWFDLRRYGMPEIRHVYRAVKGGDKLVYTLEHNDPLYTLPLPQSLFTNNLELVQNACRSVADRVPEIYVEENQ